MTAMACEAGTLIVPFLVVSFEQELGQLAALGAGFGADFDGVDRLVVAGRMRLGQVAAEGIGLQVVEDAEDLGNVIVGQRAVGVVDLAQPLPGVPLGGVERVDDGQRLLAPVDVARLGLAGVLFPSPRPRACRPGPGKEGRAPGPGSASPRWSPRRLSR